MDRQISPLEAARAVARVEEAIAIKRSRMQESIHLFEPTAIQAPIVNCTARTITISGGNRSSKTTIAAYLWACWLLGKRKHESLPAENGRAYFVGANETHLGEVMYRKLFRPGMFKVIRDKQTGLLRAFRPWDAEDAARYKEARPAEALIPPRFIETTSYRLKKDNIPRMVKLKNGWEILFLTGEGVPAQGFDANGVWFDEEIGNPDWFMEAMRGLIDRRGVFVWSATPQAATEQFLRLMERAGDDETGRLAKFVLPTTTNPHLSQAEVEEYAANLSEEQQQVRIQGEPAVQSFLMFPTFDMEVVGLDRDKLQQRQVPEDWTRYMYVDPGYGVTYCLFVAVPPKNHPIGDIWLVYDELYLPKCTADKFAESVALKIGSQYFQAYILDMQHGRKTETSGKTNMQQLSDALRARRCASVDTNYGFMPAYTDRLAGWSLLRDAMRVRSGQGTKLRILRDSCPNLERTLKRLRRQRKRAGTGWVYEDDVAPGQDDHPCDALRYMAAHDPIWVFPEPKPPAKSWAVLRYEEKMRKAKSEKPTVILGPARFLSNN